MDETKESKIKVTKPRSKDEVLQLIIDIAADYDGYHTAEDLKSLIDELAEIAYLGLKADGWISVDERLPEEGKEVWITDGVLVYETEYPKPVILPECTIWLPITHWMPKQKKPEPPKPKEEKQ